MVRASTRMFITKLHLLVAAFIFPAIAMFLVTGGLYTWGITGEYEDSSHVIELSQPLEKDEAALVDLASKELGRLGIAQPSGKYRVRSMGDAYMLEWTGSRRDVTLEPTAEPLQAKLTVKETTWYRNLVQLHKAKGATAFKIYATILAVSLFVLVLSGLVISLVTPAFRRMTYWASGVGLVAFVAAIALG